MHIYIYAWGPIYIFLLLYITLHEGLAKLTGYRTTKYNYPNAATFRQRHERDIMHKMDKFKIKNTYFRAAAYGTTSLLRTTSLVHSKCRALYCVVN